MATKDPELRKRLDEGRAAGRDARYLTCTAKELQTFGRITGHADIHDLSVKDLCTTDHEICRLAGIPHA